MTTGATGILARYKHGTVFVGHPRREIFIQMTGVHTKEQAKSLAQEVLNHQKQVSQTNSYQGVSWYSLDPPGGSELPGVGGTLNGEHVAGLTATLSNDHVEVVAELTDPYQIRQEGVLRKVERASSGTISLWGSTLTGPPDPQQGDGFSSMEFSTSATLQELLERDPDTDEQLNRDSPVWRTKVGWRGSYMSCSLQKPGSSTSRIDLIYIDEDLATNTYTEQVIATCYIGKDKRYANCRIADWFPGLLAGECCLVRVVSAGIDAKDLSVSLHGGTV